MVDEIPFSRQPLFAADCSGPGMALSVNFQKVLEIEMGVFLRGRQAFVTEKLLDHSQIRPPAQKMRGKGMPEGMGTYFPPQRRTLYVFVYCSFHRSGG